MPWFKGCGLVDCEVGGVQDDFGLTFRDGRVMFGIGAPDTTIHSPDGLDDGEWHTAWATRDNTTADFELFVDGRLVGSMNNGNTRSLTAPVTMTIGCENKLSPGRCFKGQLRNITIYDSVVPQTTLIFQLQAESNEAGAVVVTSTTLSGSAAAALTIDPRDGTARSLRAALLAVTPMRPGIFQRYLLPGGAFLIDAAENATFADMFDLK